MVWDGNGNAMAEARIGFTIGISRASEAHYLAQKFRALRPSAKVDEFGYYELTELPLASMNVCVLTQGNSIEYPFQTVTPKSGDSLVVNFGDNGGLLVSVFVKEGDAAVKNVEVGLFPTDRELRSRGGSTDANGRFKIIDMAEGEYLLTAMQVDDRGRPLGYDPNGPSHELSRRVKIQQDRTIVVDYQTRTIN
jgi:hypothetical protein